MTEIYSWWKTTQKPRRKKWKTMDLEMQLCQPRWSFQHDQHWSSSQYTNYRMINNINNINLDFYNVSWQHHLFKDLLKKMKLNLFWNIILLDIRMNRLTKLLTHHKINVRNWAMSGIKTGKYNTANIASKWRIRQENQELSMVIFDS